MQLKPQPLAMFFRQFATLLTAGIPIIQSLEILESTQDPAPRLMIHNIKRELLSGKNLVQSMQRQKNHFDALTLQLIQIGEHTGKLDHMLATIAAQLEQRLALHRQIKQALFYPAIILATALFTLLAMLLFVIPRFAELFQESHIPLPWLTRALFSLSSCLQLTILPGLCIAICLVILLHKKIKLRTLFQHVSSKLPGIKHFCIAIQLEHFSRTLSLMLTAGISLPDALQLCAHGLPRTAFFHAVQALRQHLYAGLPLYRAIEKQSFFPILLQQMAKVGEESGQLDFMLAQAAQMFATDIANQTECFTKLLEPLIMAILGVVIGGMVIGMYLPIFKLGSTLS